jgi:hypothetical protein
MFHVAWEVGNKGREREAMGIGWRGGVVVGVVGARPAKRKQKKRRREPNVFFCCSVRAGARREATEHARRSAGVGCGLASRTTEGGSRPAYGYEEKHSIKNQLDAFPK